MDIHIPGVQKYCSIYLLAQTLIVLSVVSIEMGENLCAQKRLYGCTAMHTK